MSYDPNDPNHPLNHPDNIFRKMRDANDRINREKPRMIEQARERRLAAQLAEKARLQELKRQQNLRARRKRKGITVIPPSRDYD